jgi:hypothetical protein
VANHRHDHSVNANSHEIVPGSFSRVRALRRDIVAGEFLRAGTNSERTRRDAVAHRHALATFRRDVAPTATQKIAQQKALVALREERVTNLKARLATGLSEEVELLCATDELLAAKQALLDLTAVAMEG